MIAIIERTRTHESLALGVSPRGSQALYRAAQGLALIEGRDYVIPDDVKTPRLASVRAPYRGQYPHHFGTASHRTPRSASLRTFLSQVEVPL